MLFLPIRKLFALRAFDCLPLRRSTAWDKRELLQLVG
jgi:hypothetical protein